MSASIFEALQNADYNLRAAGHSLQIALAKDQLHSAVILLGKGYDIGDQVEPLLEGYEKVEDVPEKGQVVPV